MKSAVFWCEAFGRFFGRILASLAQGERIGFRFVGGGPIPTHMGLGTFLSGRFGRFHSRSSASLALQDRLEALGTHIVEPFEGAHEHELGLGNGAQEAAVGGAGLVVPLDVDAVELDEGGHHEAVRGGRALGSEAGGEVLVAGEEAVGDGVGLFERAPAIVVVQLAERTVDAAGEGMLPEDLGFFLLGVLVIEPSEGVLIPISCLRFKVRAFILRNGPRLG